jgi:hypothetical protein
MFIFQTVVLRRIDDMSCKIECELNGLKVVRTLRGSWVHWPSFDACTLAKLKTKCYRHKPVPTGSGHCITHGQVVAVEGTSNVQIAVSDMVTRIVDLIKSSQRKSRSFSTLCYEMGGSYQRCCCPQVPPLLRAFEQRSDILLCNVGHPFRLSSSLCVSVCFHRSIYLTNIFTNTDKLNLSFQGMTHNYLSTIISEKIPFYPKDSFRRHTLNVMSQSSLHWWFSEWTWESGKW